MFSSSTAHCRDGDRGREVPYSGRWIDGRRGRHGTVMRGVGNNRLTLTLKSPRATTAVAVSPAILNKSWFALYAQLGLPILSNFVYI